MTRLVEDRGLLDGFRRGDRAALAEVYREYARPLFALLARGFAYEAGGKTAVFQGFSEPWAREEALQEVFARAFAEPARLGYDGLRPYRNYLFTIARNHVVDLLRTRGRETLVDEPPEAERPEPPPPAADDLAGSAELAAHCRAFVEGLEPAERRLFEARFEQGLSIAEAALRLGITEHRTKRDEARLRKRFFYAMKQHGYFDGLGYYRSGLARPPRALLLLLLGVRG